MTWLEQELAEMEQQSRRRQLRPLRPLSPVEALMAGQRVCLFSTNDYLGLSGHPSVLARMLQLTEEFGFGPRGAALLCGYTVLHEQLEQEIARLKRTEAALLFPTGYMANLGILQALGGRDAAIFSDELNHASIIDGCRLSKSKVYVYRHTDVDHLEACVRASTAGRKIIITEGLFSMDGDRAPLTEMVEVKEKYGCLLILDEAHSTLVFGEKGGGLAEHFGVGDRVDVQMGTLSKALGSLGGYAATHRLLREYLLNRARSFIFTTALPIPAVAAALAALETFGSQPALRASLWRNIESLSTLLDQSQLSNWWGVNKDHRWPGPIFPLVVGEAVTALELSQRLFDRGFHVPAIRPPTVPVGTSRLRLSLSARHQPGHLVALVNTLEDERRRLRS
ncbi:MAG: 8-amino-7-oxononanoate synthase [Acidobacteria bacterium]|nr:8-amino-7-oxononanoate synthase [Acidobacteriota bacterium]